MRPEVRSRGLSAGNRRHGAVLVLVAFLMVGLVGVLALSIDLGYVALVRGQLQNTADAAALAAASQLLDRDQLRGDTRQVNAVALGNKEVARFGALHRVASAAPTVRTSDIAYGYLTDTRTTGRPLDASTRPYNTVEVTVHRSAESNGELDLFFAPVFGRKSLALAATARATFETGIKGFRFDPPTTAPQQKSLLLPFAVDVAVWDAAIAAAGADVWTYDPQTKAVRSGSDGIREIKLFPSKTGAPGNLGTVDIGDANNSTNDLVRQILNGPSRADFDKMGGTVELGSGGTLVLEGDTGLSAAVKTPLTQIIGQPRVIPLYRSPVTGTGNNSRYTIVRFAGCVVLSVSLTGPYKYVTVQPEFVSDKMAFGGVGEAVPNSFIVRPLRLTR